MLSFNFVEIQFLRSELASKRIDNASARKEFCKRNKWKFIAACCFCSASILKLVWHNILITIIEKYCNRGHTKHSFETVFNTRQFKWFDSSSTTSRSILDCIRLCGVALRNEVWYEQLYDYFIFSSSVVFGRVQRMIVTAYCNSSTPH